MQRDRANMYLEKITKKDMLIYKNYRSNVYLLTVMVIYNLKY